jgi:transcriptional regulator PpsR
MKLFRAPKNALGDLDAEAAALLVSAAADVALIIDQGGIIRDVAFNSADLALDLSRNGGGHDTWLGRPWASTVTSESRTKVEAIIRDSAAGGESRWRHVNQLGRGGASVPILYSAVRVGTQNHTVVFGRDLRPMSVLQQRLVDAQASMEREYSRLRHAETRYRLLFQMSADPVMIMDATLFNVVDSNPAAARLLARPEGNRAPARPATAERDGQRASAASFNDIFDARGRAAVRALLEEVRTNAKADDVRATLANGEREVLVTASPFQQDGAALLLVRLAMTPGGEDAIVLPKPKSKLLKLVESAPDGFVVTTQEGSIVTANAAFMEMVQLAAEDLVRDEPLDRWLGRPGVDMQVLLSNLHERGPVRLFATTVRGEYGATTAVEVSAVSVMNGGLPCYGFAIRDVELRLGARPAPPVPVPGARSVEQLTELIGRVPMKDLVREATDMIERLCIEAALELTKDNRASAAEVLGLSRQSLYVKLRRFGMGELGPDPAGAQG